VAGRITQRSTGRQKQARFLPVGKLLVKGRTHFKINSFFAFAACELSRYSPIRHSYSLANESITSIKICNKKLVSNQRLDNKILLIDRNFKWFNTV
jgi:hypothetical protein